MLKRAGLSLPFIFYVCICLRRSPVFRYCRKHLHTVCKYKSLSKSNRKRFRAVYSEPLIPVCVIDEYGNEERRHFKKCRLAVKKL